ncbi:hypothetical protein ONE63_000843 [Megalurothrips usitatus]|uniref:Uncharacterized protein n=1 Tax=Megalurothrips usitatus TaxID=439358 RepID=A0AAV7XZR3_9NEOP|nr:hypothetical protein ONE63_000843 [Megalurothrips usitatus]
MASSLVLDDVGETPTDNSLIVLINNDGTLTVDPKDLKTALENKKDAAISVIRVGRPLQKDSGTDTDDGDVSHVNLTVEGFYSPSTASSQGFMDDLTNASDEDSFIDASSLTIVDPASDNLHIDHCYTNRLSNRQILKLSVGLVNPEVKVQLENADAVENCPALGQDGTARVKTKLITFWHLQSRGIRGVFKEVAGRSQESSASALQHIVLKPPPNSPASATLVPLVKPLVLKQVARKGMSRGGGNVMVLGKHVSSFNFYMPPPCIPVSTLCALGASV